MVHLNAEFQRIVRRDEKAFFSDQCKEIEENNRMGKTRDVFKKIRDTKETFHASSVQSLSHVRLFVSPWTAACQASMSTTNSWSLLKLMSFVSVMPSNHLILCPHLTKDRTKNGRGLGFWSWSWLTCFLFHF